MYDVFDEARGKFDTKLTPDEEVKFQDWKKVNAPQDSGIDYDLRGAFKAGISKDSETQHWPDTFKKPNHPTFSTQSMYAKDAPEKAGRWENDVYIPAGGSPITPIPVDIQFDDKLHSFYNAKPFEMKPEPEQAGFFKTFGAEFKAQSELYQIKNYANRSSDLKSPLDDYIPPNWKPSDDPSVLEGVEKKNWGFILDANGPNDQKRRQYLALEQQHNEELVNNGSFLGMLAGGLAGATVGSPSILIPIVGEAKYAKLGTSVIMNMMKTAPGLSLQAATHEAVIQTTKIGGNLEDFALDTFRDTVAGLAFVGAGTGLAHGFEGIKLWEAKKYINLAYDGYEVKPVIAEDGSITGYKATTGRNDLSAAETDFVQEYLNSSMATNGLFAIPKIGGWLGKGAGAVNPIVRMLNSPFATVRGFIDRMADHGIITKGIESGREAPEKFEVLMAQLGGDNKKMYYDLNGLFLQRNGIENGPRVIGDLKALKQKWTDNGYVTKSEFGKEIRNVLINAEPSQHSAVNEAAELLRTKMDKSYTAFRNAFGLPDSWLPPKTAEGYLNRVYDVNFMQLNLEGSTGWNAVVSNWLKEADKEIATHMRPINEAKDVYKAAKQEHLDFLKKPNLTDAQIKESADKVLAYKKNYKALSEKMQDQLRENPDLRIHLDDFGALSSKEAKVLKKLLQPMKKIDSNISAQQKIINDLKQEIFFGENAASVSKSKDPAERHLARAEEAKAKLPAEEEKLKKLKDDKFIEDDRLQQMVADGKVDPILYQKEADSQRVKFKNPNDRLKFRDVYESDMHRLSAARGYYDTILNQTSEDTIGQVMGRLLGRHGENALKERTLMIPDQVLYDANFLSNDLAVNVMNYRNALGRRTFLKHVYGDITLDGGIGGIADRLTKEYSLRKGQFESRISEISVKNDDLKKKIKDSGTTTEKQKVLIQQYADQTKAFKKEIDKLGKQFNSAKEDMALSYEKAMGRTRYSKKAREYANITRGFAAAVRLGAVPLTMSTDMMAIAFKHGFWPMIRDGLLPILQNVGGMLKTQSGKDFIENAAHAHLGFNDVLTAYGDRNWSGTAQQFEPITGKVSSVIDSMAHMSGNIYMTNYIENFLQRWTASVYQSQVMRWMLDHQAGKLSDKNRQKLLVYGLNPDQWSEKFIKSWKSRGSDGNGFGGYQSRYYEWADTEAANAMSTAILRATRDTIIRRGMFDAPFALDNPWISTIFTFKGYTAASLTRYMTPLMQNPKDAEKVIGTVLMLAAGATVDPLRRISRGEDPVSDDESFWWGALTNSGVLSSVTETLEDINVLTGGTLLKDVKNDRYKDRTLMGLMGPVAGMGEDFYKIIGMAASGEYNQTDLNKLARLIPPTQAWYLRYLSNKMVQSTDLPKTRGQAAKQ